MLKVKNLKFGFILKTEMATYFLKHLGKTIKNYKGSNSVSMNGTMPFQGNPTATNRTFSLDNPTSYFLGNMA